MPVPEVSPFAEPQPQKGSQPQPSPRAAGPPSRVVFLVCVFLGLAVVGWRAYAKQKNARACARTEAASRAAAIDLQLSQAVIAVDSLAATARQSGGVFSDFQQVAARQLSLPAGLAAVELQPGGVVGDVAPRAGNERALGVNVLNDPAQRTAATAAIQTRSITFSAPITLAHGEPGLVVRAPVFLRGRDGRDTFWGFLAVSMRLADLLGRAGVADLPKLGYDYAVFSAPSPSQKAAVVSAAGEVSVEAAVKQRVGAPSGGFILALEPSRGWINKTRVAVECIGVIGLSTLLALLSHLLDSRHALDEALVDAKRRLTTETAARKQAQEESAGEKESARATRTELKLARAEMEETKSILADSQARLETLAHNAQEINHSKAADLQQMETELREARASIDELETRLQAVARVQQETESAARTRGELDAATIVDLKTRVSAANRQAKEAAEAGAAKLKELEASHRELKERLAAAEKATTQVAEQKPVADTERKTNEEEQATPEAEPEAVGMTAPVLEPVVTLAPAPSALPSEQLPGSQEAQAAEKPVKPARARKARGQNQMDLFGSPAPAPRASEVRATEQLHAAPEPLVIEPTLPSAASPELEPAEAGAATAKLHPSHPLPPAPALDPAQFRKAASLIVPLLTDGDPGAADCLKSNRATFRSGFSPEGYVEFEQMVKGGEHAAALEQLRRAGKRHGISV